MTDIYEIEGTPIDIVRHTDVRADVECLIYPIHINHTQRLDQLLRAEPFFSGVDFIYEGYAEKINTVICRFDCWGPGELALKMPDVEPKVNEVFERFLDESKGYFAVRA